LDAAGEGRLADEAVAPHLVEQLLLGHDAIPVGDEVPEDVEDLGLERDHLTAGPQLERVGIELVGAEAPDHAGVPGPAKGRGDRAIACMMTRLTREAG